jgi:AmiR/NasT family two-component response regulator
MDRIKVLVANSPRLMRELVLATLSDQPDIEVTGEIQDDNKIVEAVEQVHPDFLIVALGESEERPGICDLLLDRHPHMKILALAPERNASIFYWVSLSIRSNRIETSEQGILNALRSRTPLGPAIPDPSAGHKAN